MVISSLLKYPSFATVLERSRVTVVPSKKEIQTRIQVAWNVHRFDPPGAAVHSGILVNSREWIGACEAVVLLRSLGIRAAVADFDNAQDAMLEFCFKYFHERCRGTKDSNCLACRNSFFGKNGALLPPLLLQHDGHSRTICGVERTKLNEIKLLVADPNRYFARKVNETGAIPVGMMRMTYQSLTKNPQYQVVWIPVEDGVIATRHDFDALKTIINSEQNPNFLGSSR
jgi:zinc finger-containing ubiquitin peptidase 1